MIDGASGSENRFVVDGVDRTNARTGTATAIIRTPRVVVQDFIEEVQVKQSGWNAEYRAALGGVVNAVTKTGSNSFHGSAGTYYTDNKWLGDIRRTLRSVPTNAAAAEYIQSPRDDSHQTDVVAPAGRADHEGQGLVLCRLCPAVLPGRAHGDLDDPRHLPGDADVRQRLAEQQGPQLQRDLAARQPIAGAFHRQQRDAEGRPRASGASNPTAPARRARPPSTRAPRCSPNSSRMPTAASSTGWRPRRPTST